MPEPLAPGDSPGLLLWRTTLRWQRQITATLKPLGLTHVQFVLLASAWWLTHVAKETPSQRRIADLAGTDPMMTSQVVRALEHRGLLTREPDPNDSRAMLIGVTEAGATLAPHAVALVEKADREFFGAVADRGALIGVLRALA